MQNFLYSIAVLLVVLWALGYFVYNLGSFIHLALIVAVVAIILRLIGGPEEEAS